MEALEYALEHIKDDVIGLIGGNVCVEPLNAKYHLAACIDPELWNIHIKLNEKWNFKRDRWLMGYLKKHNIDTLIDIAKSLLYHEGVHWLENGGCPTSLEYHDIIKETIYEVLKQQKKEAHTDYVTNAFEDIVVNTTAKFIYPPYAGQVVFFYDQFKSNKTPSNFYETFVKLNMEIWGDSSDKELLKPYFTDNDNVNGCVEEILKLFNIPAGNLTKAQSVLSDKSNWVSLAKIFAASIAKFVEKGISIFLLGPDSSFEKKAGTIDGKGIIMGGRLAADKHTPYYMKSYEGLDALYQRLSRKITLKVDDIASDMGLPIVKYGYKVFDPTKHSPFKINFKKMGFDPDSPFKHNINFKVATISSDINISCKQNIGALPDICFIIDTSGSMIGGGGNRNLIPWGTESWYHYALLGVYGVIKELQEKSAYIRWNLIQFSSKTFSSGWLSFSALHKLKKLALTPQSGGTAIDMAVLKKELSTGNCVVIMLSDGEIYNIKSIKNAFISLMRRHLFSFINIGKVKSYFSEELIKSGFSVYSVKDKRDITGLIINISASGINR